MRFLATIAATALIAPALPAQPAQPVEQRVRRLEGEVRAIQRRVFPNGAPVTAETQAETPPASGQAVVDLNARVGSLETSFRTLTGQVEELENRIRQLEARATEPQPVQVAPVAPTPEPTPTPEPEATTPEPLVSSEVETPATTPVAATEPLPSDPAEAAYVSGFRLYQAGQHDAAIETLQAMAKRYPRHAKASWANNLAGRAHLAAGRPATAAELFFANYQGNPRGERAPDSLFYLGESLTKLDKREQACKVYDELETVYGRTLRAQLRTELPAARKAARCA